MLFVSASAGRRSSDLLANDLWSVCQCWNSNDRIAIIASHDTALSDCGCMMVTGRKDASASSSIMLGIVRLCGGASGNSRNSRFGGINSRFGCSKFPFSCATGIRSQDLDWARCLQCQNGTYWEQSKKIPVQREKSG